MGILDKIMFWRKKDEFSSLGLGDKEDLAFGDNFNPGLDQTGFQQSQGQQNLGPQPFQSQPSYQPQFPQPYPRQYENPYHDVESKNIEVISSKLDALRASLDSINQRLANLEAIARGEEEDRKRRYY